MGTLDGVGHGTALGGRYRLEERLRSEGGATLWRAVDGTLDRPVDVHVVTGEHAEDALDAARRAAMVAEPRLVKVVDVGTELAGGAPSGTGRERDTTPLTYVVTEHVEAPTLAELVAAEGPLPPEVARSVVGETAEALERARRTGLHHRRLHPGSVHVLDDGEVKVSGLAVQSAAAGAEDEDDVSAARQDAVALVAVLYAAMTGRWPLRPTGSSLPPAPLVAGRCTPPADLVPGVPNDLDTLCEVTLGPHGDGPRTPGELADELAPWGSARTVAQRPAAGHRPAARFPVPLAAPADAPAAAPDRPAPGEPAPGEPARSQAPTQAPPGTGSGRAVPAGVAAVAGMMAGGRAGSPESPDSPDSPESPQEPSPGVGSGGGTDEPRVPFAQAVGTGPYAAEPRGATPVQKIVLVAVAAALVVLLAVAVSTLAGIGGDDGRTAAPEPTTQATDGSTPSGEPAPTTSPAPTGSPAAPPQVVGGVPLDPQGDQSENEGSASDAYDGDEGSYWQSETYNSADFGGLKEGVGYAIQLAQPASVSAVTLVVNGEGGAFEVRTAPDAGLGGSQVVAEASTTGGPVDVPLPEPVETGWLVLWFTELPSTDAGFRVELAEVGVR
ncbi:protein kinase family protein [Thalassiella azotivora]